MSNFFISKAAVTGADMVELVDTCRNTTVGPNKYQLYCASTTNVNGACTTLPAKDTVAGKLNCVSITSQAYLRSLYDSTGLACAVNCYYPLSVDLPTFSIPPLDLPSFSFSYTLPSRTYTLPTPTPQVSGSSSGSGNNGSGNSGNSGNNGNDIPLVGPPGGNALSGSLTASDPNLMFTFMAVFAIMLLFIRRAI